MQPSDRKSSPSVVWLTGECGVGKTIVGGLIARTRGLSFIDNDRIKEIFFKEGWERQEAGRIAYNLMIDMIMHGIQDGTSFVVAAPISIPETLSAVRDLRRHCNLNIFELTAAPDVLDARILARAKNLPINKIAVRTAKDRVESFTHQMRVAIPEAVIVDTQDRSPWEVVQAITRELPKQKEKTEDFTLAAAALITRNLPRPIVVASGVFDLLHPGHLKYLRSAAKLGASLIVHVGADFSVKRRKGPGRPIMSSDERCLMVEAITEVDLAFISGSHTLTCATELNADIVAVTEEARDEFESVRQGLFSGEIVYTNRIDDTRLSTSAILKRVIVASGPFCPRI
ncbi:adenylyltransferase/cytidyltransferase family protein [Pseudomonas sp. MN1F]|uniref:adenylyltransferase/cytidyltransferase family protein n=1 Tax=Pseudomonas sp. MN1F TaxID=1366632 RepID=UPI00128F08F1|nr:adenylyltransferase/cytidyltransferase family protein [Pseudomonas sp. MN1F]MQG92030.1 adenylyltransferase/cytidyltransferase family protein [Pseudomonas sp. MN1F]